MPIRSLHVGSLDFHHRNRSLGYQLLAEPPQCLTGPLRRRLLGIHYLALHGILSFSFLFHFSVHRNKIYRTVDPSSLTPAWNPPQDHPLATNSRIASKQPERPQHPLLDERLVGANLKVVVDDGGETYNKREVAVLIAKVEGEVSNVYGTSKGLVPAWVLPKIPNPTHDNGLIMAVKGDHCGKYDR